jgi:hypothetical protein
VSAKLDRVSRALNAMTLRAELAEATVTELKASVDALGQLLHDAEEQLRANEWRSYCTYCGQESTATSEQERTEQMGAHIDVCERHPLRILAAVSDYLNLPTSELLPENIPALPEKLAEHCQRLALDTITEAQGLIGDALSRVLATHPCAEPGCACESARALVAPAEAVQA